MDKEGLKFIHELFIFSTTVKGQCTSQMPKSTTLFAQNEALKTIPLRLLKFLETNINLKAVGREAFLIMQCGWR